MNTVIPGAGTLAKKAIDIATLGNADRLGHLLHGGPRLLLRWPHGLGDAVQGTVVVKHIKHFYPAWRIDIAAKLGQGSVFHGLAENIFEFHGVTGQYWGAQPNDADYNAAATLDWWEPDQCYSDSPATKAEKCLREVFGVTPLAELCRYEVTPSAAIKNLVAEHAPREPFACVHYQGNSAASNKNLNELAIRAAVEVLIARGLLVVLLDWDQRSGLLREPSLITSGRLINYPAGHPIWGQKHGTGEAAAIAALLARSRFNLGIDSGPGHLMGAVDVPAAIVWQRHHPLNFYCLAPNVTHLVRSDHDYYIRGDRDTGLAYFAGHYRHKIMSRDLRLELPETVAELCQT